MGPETLSALLPYTLFGTGMGLCLYLFCSAKAELRALQKRAAEKHELLETALRQLDLKVEQAATSQRVGYPPRTSGIDLTTRTQALRMDRRGESPATIAGALGVPRNEIDLMLKVHRLITGTDEKRSCTGHTLPSCGTEGPAPERTAAS